MGGGIDTTMQEDVVVAAPTPAPRPAKVCIDCGGSFVTKGRCCRKCYKRRNRHKNNRRKCVCGKVLSEKAVACAECWRAACRVALEQIAAKCGRTLVQPVAIPERYMPRVSVGYKYGEGE